MEASKKQVSDMKKKFEAWSELPSDPTFIFQPGWYAVLICWDPQEGVFPKAVYHDGTKWDNPIGPIAMYNPAVFESEQAAEDWAEGNDPDM